MQFLDYSLLVVNPRGYFGLGLSPTLQPVSAIKHDLGFTNLGYEIYLDNGLIKASLA